MMATSNSATPHFPNRAYIHAQDDKEKTSKRSVSNQA